MEIAVWIIEALVIFLAAQYVLGPVLVWWKQRLPEKYRFKLLDSEKFLSARTAVFIALHEEIQAGNFEYIGSSELMMSDVSMYFSIYNNFDKKIACTLVTAHSIPEDTSYIEFTQMYENGSVLNVSNASIINVYPKSEMRLAFRFPEVNDFHRLLELAEKLIRTNRKNEQKITFTRGNEFAAVEAYLDRELNKLVDRGWVQSGIVAGGRRLTVKGALLMTWKMVWPARQILNKSDIAFSERAAQNA